MMNNLHCVKSKHIYTHSHASTSVKSKKDQCKSKHIKKFKDGISNLLIFQLSIPYKINPAKGIHQDVICEPGTTYI